MVVLIGWGLAACASWPPSVPGHDQAGGPSTCDGAISAEHNTSLAVIANMIDEGKVYAAIAQLDKLSLSAPKAQLLRAKALRYTVRATEAKALYTGLLRSCHAGQAHHGLGLLAMKSGDTAEGLVHLQAASKALPTDPDVRNDLGFAFMQARRLDDARFELMTALDLSPNHPRAARNLVILLLRQGEAAQAEALGRKLGLDPASMDQLRTQAAVPATTTPLENTETP